MNAIPKQTIYVFKFSFQRFHDKIKQFTQKGSKKKVYIYTNNKNGEAIIYFQNIMFCNNTQNKYCYQNIVLLEIIIYK